MNVLVAGGTGFIGVPLCHTLIDHGQSVTVLTRRPGRAAAQRGLRHLGWEDPQWRRLIGQFDAVVNLAGEPPAAKRWSATQKRAIRESRLRATVGLIEAMASAASRPRVLINASAIGYYGPRGDEELTEAASPGGGFLSELCVAWEEAAQRAEPLGVRVVRLRIGLVLGPDGGALAKMVPPFRLFVGGPLGSGRQWVSWIHRHDLIGLIEWALAHPALSGALNATAPQPKTMHEFARELGRVLSRPSWLPAPAFALRLLLGEMADLLLTGQRVLPALAMRHGYQFTYPKLDGALTACLR